MPARIVLFGATGYTGRLTAAALREAGAEPVLAARDPKTLAALAEELGGGLETAVADVADPPSVRALVEPGEVIDSTV
ncbi:MAG: NAD(P)H-binding protein, partial [Thermoleophilia bacterium]|nr:NAD(P)H-binding protein [Thermoleophilia bacterium]